MPRRSLSEGDMGGHHHHHLHQMLSFHLPHIGRKEVGELPPKGCMAVRVGVEGEERQRFVVPVMYLTHPLFLRLLKEAEEEYGFEQKGAIVIPCHVEYFRQIQEAIDRERVGGGSGVSSRHHHGNHQQQQQQHQHHHHLPLAGCFRA